MRFLSLIVTVVVAAALSAQGPRQPTQLTFAGESRVLEAKISPNGDWIAYWRKHTSRISRYSSQFPTVGPSASSFR